MGDLQRIDERAVYTATETADLLKVSENVVYKLLKEGKLIARKTNDKRGYWRVLGENIVLYLKTGCNETPGA